MFDMLDFALEYRTAVQKMTEAHEETLGMYEMANSDWKIAEQLRDVLRVSPIISHATFGRLQMLPL